MYAVGMVNDGNNGMRIPCGNDGLQMLHNKSRKGWITETTGMRNNTDAVYIVNNFTQEMCEMSNVKLVKYVISHAICRLPRF